MTLDSSQIAPPPQTTNLGFRIVRVVLGVFLLAAAGLKAHGLTIDPLSQDSFLASPRIQVAVIEVETLLGLLLLSGWLARPAWMASLVFFGILAGVSLYLALAGQRSCGCFGQVHVNPWLTFVLDLAAVAALLLWRPAPTSAVHQPAWVLGLLKTVAGATALLVLIAGTFLLALDNPPDALAHLRGESLTVVPGSAELGDGVAGEKRTFTIRLQNHTSHPIRIVGGTTTCACVTTRDLPVTIEPGKSQTLNVWVRFSGETGRFMHRFTLYTDDDKQRTVIARFGGHLVEPPN